MSQYTPRNAALALFAANTTPLNQAILARWQPEAPEELLEILGHDVASWAPSGFIYNEDLKEFYDLNRDDIRAMLREYQEESSHPTILSMVCAWCPTLEPWEVENALYIDGDENAHHVVATIVWTALSKRGQDFMSWQGNQE